MSSTTCRLCEPQNPPQLHQESIMHRSGKPAKADMVNL